MPFVIANDKRIIDLIESWEKQRRKKQRNQKISSSEIQLLNLKKIQVSTYLQKLQEKALMQKQRKLQVSDKKYKEEEDILYILSHDGRAIATGNWRKPNSYMGQQLTYAPYFLDAYMKNEGEAFALGIKKEKPSYFLSSPILINKQKSGVAVIQIDLTALQNNWESISEPVLISDEFNVSILSGKKQWLWKTLEDLPKKSLQAIRKQRRYQGKTLSPLATAKNSDGNKLLIQGKYYYFHSAPLALGKSGWTIHYFTPESEITQRMWGAGLIAAICGIMILLLAILRKLRRRERQARLERVELKRTREFNTKLELQIAEREKAEKELRAVQEELIQTGKLSALGDMAAAMAHELNQPITALKMDMFNARKLIMSGKPESKILPVLADMESLTDRMRNITEQLKAFARKEPVSLSRIDLHEIIEQAQRMLKPQLSTYDCKLNLNLHNSTLFVEADEGRLEQVLINLMRNAIDAMKNEEEKILSISTGQSATSILIHVEDTGSGVPVDQMAHIFEPFYTTKSAGAGIGLGLAISKRIIENFKGRLSVIETPGNGACFEIMLPIPKEEENTKAIA